MINTKELISRQANYVPKLMPLPPDVPLTADDCVSADGLMVNDGYGA